MSRYYVGAANGMVAMVGKTAYATAAALKKALEYRDAGYKNITLTNEDTGAVLDVGQFMREHPNA